MPPIDFDIVALEYIFIFYVWLVNGQTEKKSASSEDEVQKCACTTQQIRLPCSKGRVCATASKEIYDLTLPVSKYTILELIYAGINTLRT